MFHWECVSNFSEDVDQIQFALAKTIGFLQKLAIRSQQVAAGQEAAAALEKALDLHRNLKQQRVQEEGRQAEEEKKKWNEQREGLEKLELSLLEQYCPVALELQKQSAEEAEIRRRAMAGRGQPVNNDHEEIINPASYFSRLVNLVVRRDPNGPGTLKIMMSEWKLTMKMKAGGGKKVLEALEASFLNIQRFGWVTDDFFAMIECRSVEAT